jgi:hypothetical protein
MEEVKILRQLLLIALSILISLSFVLATHADNVPGRSDRLDSKLDELLDRIIETRAIGTFTKLSLKGNVTRLNKAFAVYHQGKRPPSLEELRERYDVMLQEMIILFQKKDPDLARDLYAARMLLWSYLIDPEKHVSF